MKKLLMLVSAAAFSLATANAQWGESCDDRPIRGTVQVGYGYDGYRGRDSYDRHDRYDRHDHRDHGRYRPAMSLEARAQLRLRQQGYYYGPIDGDFGYGSRRALYRFQRDHRLPMTGYLDWRTRRSLGL